MKRSCGHGVSLSVHSVSTVSLIFKKARSLRVVECRLWDSPWDTIMESDCFLVFLFREIRTKWFRNHFVIAIADISVRPL